LEGEGAARLSAVTVETPHLGGRAEHLAFWRLFHMQRAGPGGNQGHDAGVAIGRGDVCCVTGIRWEQAT